MFDIVIRDGKVLDGAGNPWFKANIGISGDSIAEVSRKPMDGEKVIEPRGSWSPRGSSIATLTPTTGF